MNKPLVGALIGAVLGLMDGATSWFTPEVRDQMTGILMGSTFKGLLVGVLSGWYARKVNSTAKGIFFGAVLGLILAFAVAAMPNPQGRHYYLEIMLPGFVTGALVGFLTQRLGTPARTA